MKLAFVQYDKCVFHPQMIAGILISSLFLFLFLLHYMTAFRKLTSAVSPFYGLLFSHFVLIVQRTTFKNYFYESNN